MFVCKFCGKILGDGSRFCNSCGAMVTDPAKASYQDSVVSSTEHDENITLDSLIESIDTFSVNEQDDITTVAFSEENGKCLLCHLMMSPMTVKMISQCH